MFANISRSVLRQNGRMLARDFSLESLPKKVRLPIGAIFAGLVVLGGGATFAEEGTIFSSREIERIANGAVTQPPEERDGDCSETHAPPSLSPSASVSVCGYITSFYGFPFTEVNHFLTFV